MSNVNSQSMNVMTNNGVTYFNGVKLGTGCHTITVVNEKGQSFYKVGAAAARKINN